MKEYSRVNDAVRNTIFGIFSKIIILVGAFATKTILIYVLGIEYVGLDGLFASILTMLNMAELGFGSAIVYKLYKPISEENTDLVCALLKYYRKIYRIIGAVVLVLGVALTPFLSYFISGNIPPKTNIYILYFIYLLNTCFSYWFFAYKMVLLNAHNRNDLVSKAMTITNIIKYAFQIALLLLVKNYYVYAIVIPVTTLLCNCGYTLIAKKYYPYYICRGSISAEDKKEIKNKVIALMYNKVGTTIISGGDNLVISAFLGLSILGVYDSYYYIFTMLYYFFSVLHSAITAGVGNSILVNNLKKNKNLFNNAFFVNSWLTGWCSICLACLYEPFMQIWIGKENTFGNGYAFVMSLYFYFWMIRSITTIFKSAQGLWWEDRYRAALEGICNLLLNIILVNFIGIYGVTLSTIIAMLTISLPWETNVLFKKYFKEKPTRYYLSLLKWFIVTLVSGVATYILCGFVKLGGIVNFIVRAAICILIPNLINFLVYYKSSEFVYSIKLIKQILKKYIFKKETQK